MGSCPPKATAVNFTVPQISCWNAWVSGVYYNSTATLPCCPKFPLPICTSSPGRCKYCPNGMPIENLAMCEQVYPSTKIYHFENNNILTYTRQCKLATTKPKAAECPPAFTAADIAAGLRQNATASECAGDIANCGCRTVKQTFGELHKLAGIDKLTDKTCCGSV